MNTCFDCQVLVKKDKKIRKKKLKMSINSANEERVRNTVNRRQKNLKQLENALFKKCTIPPEKNTF